MQVKDKDLSFFNLFAGKNRDDSSLLKFAEYLSSDPARRLLSLEITSSVTLFILEFVRSVVMNDFTERTDSLISAVNN